MAPNPTDSQRRHNCESLYQGLTFDSPCFFLSRFGAVFTGDYQTAPHRIISSLNHIAPHPTKRKIKSHNPHRTPPHRTASYNPQNLNRHWTATCDSANGKNRTAFGIYNAKMPRIFRRRRGESTASCYLPSRTIHRKIGDMQFFFSFFRAIYYPRPCFRAIYYPRPCFRAPS